ncbi:MAG: lysozyme [Caldilineaceae bacterium]
MISDLLARLWRRSPAATIKRDLIVDAHDTSIGDTQPPPKAASLGDAVETEGAPKLPSNSAAPPAMNLVADIVAHFEGFRADAYLCPAGVYTMGYGTTRGADGKPVRPGMRVSEADARALLMRDLAGAARAVETLVSVPLADHERAALISFVYNVGQGAFAASTMLRLLNAGDRSGAAAQFARWNLARGKVLRGLVARRRAEAYMFRGEAWRLAREAVAE